MHKVSIRYYRHINLIRIANQSRAWFIPFNLYQSICVIFRHKFQRMLTMPGNFRHCWHSLSEPAYVDIDGKIQRLSTYAVFTDWLPHIHGFLNETFLCSICFCNDFKQVLFHYKGLTLIALISTRHKHTHNSIYIHLYYNSSLTHPTQLDIIWSIQWQCYKCTSITRFFVKPKFYNQIFGSFYKSATYFIKYLYMLVVSHKAKYIGNWSYV